MTHIINGDVKVSNLEGFLCEQHPEQNKYDFLLEPIRNLFTAIAVLLALALIVPKVLGSILKNES